MSAELKHIKKGKLPDAAPHHLMMFLSPWQPVSKYQRKTSLSHNLSLAFNKTLFKYGHTYTCVTRVNITLDEVEGEGEEREEENKETGKGKDLIKVDSFTVLSPLPCELTRSPPPPPPPLPWQSSCCCCWRGCCRCRPSAPTPSPPSCASSVCSGTRLSPASLHSISFEERGSG